MGCTPLTWKLYALQFQLPSRDVALGEEVGPQMNKFEQMSLIGGRCQGLVSSWW